MSKKIKIQGKYMEWSDIIFVLNGVVVEVTPIAYKERVVNFTLMMNCRGFIKSKISKQ